ncbi:hypothetical protein Cal7507_3556 [Calothrix sp. PCC 7507]|nr:hypothetical protein Cal7507_3556 [Calothrix sp. PCC 7507]
MGTLFSLCTVESVTIGDGYLGNMTEYRFLLGHKLNIY